MRKLSDIFDVAYGNKFDLNKTTPMPRGSGGVSFVGRSNRRHGISATVKPIPNCAPYPAGLITVALGGTPLASFVQEHQFYTAQNVSVLTPKFEMSLSEKIYACLCIRRNRFRYSAFGREANRTLHELIIPEPREFPAWLATALPKTVTSVATEFEALTFPNGRGAVHNRAWKTVSELFESQYGNSYELCNLTHDPRGVNYVSRRKGNNGVSARVARTSDEPFSAGLLTVALSGQGAALETSVQPAPFYTGFHVGVLTPRRPMSISEKIYYARAITMNRFRYGFGRQANRSLPSIRLPPIPEWVTPSSVDDVRATIVASIRSRLPASP